MTEEVMYIPTRELEQLIQYYKGEITDNALLNKAGRLAAQKSFVTQRQKDSRFDCRQENQTFSSRESSIDQTRETSGNRNRSRRRGRKRGR